MGELNDYSTTAGSNNSASPNGMPEGMDSSGVNNSWREGIARHKRWYLDNNGSLVTGGTDTAYTVTLNAQHSAWFNGLTFVVRFDQTNGATPTINPTGSGALGAKSLVLNDGNAPSTGAIAANAVLVLQYNSTTGKVHILSPLAEGITAASTATLTNKTWGDELTLTKGGDIASASPLVIDTDGAYFDVTGTTGFSAMTVAAGVMFMLQFDAALTMTDGAGLDLGGADITTAAGDRAIFFATAANTVQLIAYLREGTAYWDTVAVSQANQSAVEAETDENTYVPPDLLNFHPGIAKGWAQVADGGTAALQGSGRNVASVDDDAQGEYGVNWDTDFSNDDYAVAVAAISASGYFAKVESVAVGATEIDIIDTGGNSQNSGFGIIVMGDQA